MVVAKFQVMGGRIEPLELGHHLVGCDEHLKDFPYKYK